MTTIPESPDVPNTPESTPNTPQSHEDTAQAIRRALLQLVEGIRGFALLTPERRRKVTVSGHVDDDFLRSLALLLEAHPDVAAMTQLTSDEIGDHLRFSGSYHGVGEELMLNGRKMVDTLIAERASIGERAIVALKIARSINTPKDRASLVPHLEAIDRDFVRGRRRPAVKKPDEIAAAKKKEEKP
jgi:hypothetical protein